VADQANKPTCALLLGATGLTGRHLLEELLQHSSYRKVRIIVRRPLQLAHPNLEEHVVDFDHLADHADLFQCDDVFCTLGTTIRKAGTQEAFRRVDYEYPLEAARLAARQGTRQFLIVTSLGANAHSRVFYNRVKGEVEEQLRLIPFVSLHVFRPSILLGHRGEVRVGERVGIAVMKAASVMMVGSLSRYRPIEARVIARAMNRVAARGEPGIRVYESDIIQGLGKD
jgi:uncharacterized protein YbjT (DUF2867 family)